MGGSRGERKWNGTRACKQAEGNSAKKRFLIGVAADLFEAEFLLFIAACKTDK